MISEKKIKWVDREKVRKSLKKAGFISQYTVVGRYGHLDLKKARKDLTDPTRVEAIKLDTDGAISYWYAKDLNFADMEIRYYATHK